MSTDLLVLHQPLAVLSVLSTTPAIIREAGSQAERRFLEFFAANIRNRNTRAAYMVAVGRFCSWCQPHGLGLNEIQPLHVAAYIEAFQAEASVPTVKQHLASLKSLFDWLVVGQVIPHNPAASVRGPKHVVRRGKTPVLTATEARTLLDSIDLSTVVGLRDRALIGVMVYTFARVGAVVAMRVEDYFQNGKRWWVRLHEKGGKQHQVPCHHNAEAYLDAYLSAFATRDSKAPLFQSVSPARHPTGHAMSRSDVFRMVKRRVGDAGLPPTTCCHTFRATGITAYLANGGTIENAQAIAAHESPRTTKLYDRTSDEITLDEVERILI